MQEGDWWMVSHEPARRQRGQIVCYLLPTPISRGDVLEAWFFRVSLSGLDVEKKRGEDVPPVTRIVAQMAYGWRKF